MIPRYSHPTVTQLWSDEWTYDTWLAIETCALDAQRRHGVIPAEPASELISRLREYHFDMSAAGRVRAIERTTKHDVAAFLQYIRDNETYGQWLHFGLTSSDILDTAQGIRFREMHQHLLHDINELNQQLARWAKDDTPMVGRTHGQPAEPTAMNVRAWNWLALLELPTSSLVKANRAMQVAKLSGPVGTFAHNPPQVEADVAVAFHLRPMGPGASQIVPRSTLAMWASAAAAFAASCAKIATDLRLLNLTGEVGWVQSEGQIGSSAMAQKNNPIVAEQVCGLARVAAGYAQMLQPLDLWLERDISNSSVERIAVPDLWHVILRVIEQTAAMLRGLHLDHTMIEEELANHPEAWTHKMTLETIPDAQDLKEARESARIGASYGDTGGYRPAWFTRNYPQAPR